MAYDYYSCPLYFAKMRAKLAALQYICQFIKNKKQIAVFMCVRVYVLCITCVTFHFK